MTIDEILRKKYPLNEAISDLKRLTDNPAELGDFLKDDKLPLFILTFNHKRVNIPAADTFANVCKVIFVCSTDDPYLEEFKKECEEEILIFDKADYVGDKERNGDDFGLTPPYNQCGCFARRFIDDYTQKNDIKRYMVSDNDLKFGIRKYDGKRYPIDDDILSNAIRTYFYILDKYTDYFSFLNCATICGEFGGKIYKYGYDTSNYMFYFHDKPINWQSRFHDDWLSILLTLRDTGKMAFSFPYLRADFANMGEHGDMERAYEELKKTNPSEKFMSYDKFFFPEFSTEINRRGKLTKGIVIKKYVEILSDYKPNA